MQRDIGNYGSSGIPQLNSSQKYHGDCNRLLEALLQEVSMQAQGLEDENSTLRMLNDELSKAFNSIVRVVSDLTSSSTPFDFFTHFDHAENHSFSTSPALMPMLPLLSSSNQLRLDQLQEFSKQEQGLRQENIRLRKDNDVLAKAIGSAVSATSGMTCVSGKTDSNVSSIDMEQIADELWKIALEFVKKNINQDPGTDDSPETSKAVLKPVSQGSSGGKIAITGQNMSKSGNEAQKVDVPVPKVKTVLCNKWQQGGTCPFGGNCKFAHGKGELRQKVCFYFLNGRPCPFGDRCRFRHFLTDEEKLTTN